MSSRIRGSALVLKLLACAAWLGLPMSVPAAHAEANAQVNLTTLDDRQVPIEYNAMTTVQQDVSATHLAQQSPPPPRPRPPAVLSVRG